MQHNIWNNAIVCKISNCESKMLSYPHPFRDTSDGTQISISLKVLFQFLCFSFVEIINLQKRKWNTGDY